MFSLRLTRLRRRRVYERNNPTGRGRVDEAAVSEAAHAGSIPAVSMRGSSLMEKHGATNAGDEGSSPSAPIPSPFSFLTERRKPAA